MNLQIALPAPIPPLLRREAADAEILDRAIACAPLRSAVEVHLYRRMREEGVRFWTYTGLLIQDLGHVSLVRHPGQWRAEWCEVETLDLGDLGLPPLPPEPTAKAPFRERMAHVHVTMPHLRSAEAKIRHLLSSAAHRPVFPRGFHLPGLGLGWPSDDGVHIRWTHPVIGSISIAPPSP